MEMAVVEELLAPPAKRELLWPPTSPENDFSQ